MSETLAWYIEGAWSDLNAELILRANDPSRPFENLQAIVARWPADALSKAGAEAAVEGARNAKPRLIATQTKLKNWGTNQFKRTRQW